MYPKLAFPRTLTCAVYAVLVLLLMIPLSPLRASDASETLVIADAAADRGMLAPYLHAKNGAAYVYTSYVFDTLLKKVPSGEVVGALAKVWSISEDARVYDFALHTHAEWHDGQPLTAEDVVFTFHYMREHPYPFAAIGAVARAEALGPHRVRVTLTEVDAAFVSTALVSMPILPKHIYASQDAPQRFTDKTAAIGSGPYKLTAYDKAQGRYLLARHDAYYAGQPHFARVAIVTMNPDAAVVAAARGQVDVVAGLPFAKIAKAEKAGLQVQSRVSNHPIRMAFNREGLFRTREMRHALAYAIDREKLAQVVYQAGANVADTGFFQAGQFWTTTASLPTYAPDAAQATALLEAQGWTRRDGRWLHHGAPVTLRLLARKPFKKLALALADQLEDFGLGVDVRVLGRAEAQNALKKRDFDLALLSTSSQGDPGSFARRVVGPSWKSDRFSEHADMNALMAQQAREMDPNKRQAIFEEVQAIYATELPAYMLVNKMRSVAHNARIKPVFYEDGIAFGIPVSLHKDMFLR